MLAKESTNFKISPNSFILEDYDLRIYFKKLRSKRSLYSKGPSFILIHDFYDYHHYYIGLGEFLSSCFPGSDCIMVDLPGHGLSSGVRGFGEFEAHLKVLEYLVEKLKEEEKDYVLLGQGLGSLVILFHIIRRQTAPKERLLGAIHLSSLMSWNQSLQGRSLFPASALSKLIRKSWENLVHFPYLLKGEILSKDLKLGEEINSDPLVVHRMKLSQWEQINSYINQLKTYLYFYDAKSLFLFSEGDPLVELERASHLLKIIDSSNMEIETLSGLGHHLVGDKDRVWIKIKTWIAALMEEQK
jgi:alpha-beta hydrolase superfamily lysophospholipase